MATVNYYLGFKTEDGYKNIELPKEEKYSKLTNIINLVRFTNLFDSEFELKQYLNSIGVLDDTNVELCYLKREGSKEKGYSYLPARNLYGIYTSLYQEHFTYEGIRNFIEKHIDDKNFMRSLFAFTLRNSNAIGSIKNYLIDCSLSLVSYSKIIEALKDEELEPTLKEALDTYTEKTHKYTPNTELRTDRMNLNELIVNNDVAIVKIFNKLQNEIRLDQHPSFLINSISLYNSVNEYLKHPEATGSDEITKNDIDELISAYIQSFVYARKDKEFKKVDGKFVETPNAFASLGAFISSYFDYEVKVAMTKTEIVEETEDVYYRKDEDEFLTEEDFTLIGSTPEEQGFTRRRIIKCDE